MVVKQGVCGWPVSDLHPGNADAILNFRMPTFEGFGVEYGDSAKADRAITELPQNIGLNIQNRRTQNILEGGPMYIQTLTELFQGSSEALAAR